MHARPDGASPPLRSRFGRTAYALVLGAVLVAQTLFAVQLWRHRGVGTPDLTGLGIVLLLCGLTLAWLLVREFRQRDALVKALAESKNRFRDFAGSASDWIWETDSEHRFVWLSSQDIDPAAPVSGAIVGKHPWDLDSDSKNAELWAAHRADLAARRPFRNFEGTVRDATGRLRYLRASGTPHYDERGTFLGYRGTALDVTPEFEARAEAQSANARLVEAVESLSDGFAIFDAQDRLILSNNAFRSVLGRELPRPDATFTELLDITASEVIHPAQLGPDAERWKRWRLDHHRNPDGPIEIRTRDGRWARVIENRTREGGTVHIRTDITNIKKRESELKSRVAQQHALALLSQLAVEPIDLDRLMQKATQLIIRTLEMTISSVLELTSDGQEFVMRAFTGWDQGLIGTRLTVRPDFQAGYALHARMPVVSNDLARETRFRIHPMIASRGLASALTTVIEASGQPFGILSCYTDEPHEFSESEINFVKAVANVLAATIQGRQHEAQLRAILDNSVDSIVRIDENGTIDAANAATERMFGYAPADLKGRKISVLMPEYPLAAHDTPPDSALETGHSRALGRMRESQGLRRDGSIFPVDLGIRELKWGSRRFFIASMRDASERKSTEEQLRHAQKMEAVGQLTGGIAHDFNNLLSVILGNAEMMQELAANQPALRSMSELVIGAANRGAALTQRLLAFARKQALASVKFDLNELVAGTEDLLRRTLGEHIRVEHRLADGLPCAFADRLQVENALLNLAINARDAMPEGGTLTIETAHAYLDEAYAAANEIDPGSYVMLAVSDTGAGMTPEVLARVFEPFFTTKDVGKGSGLGLPMVYGFMKQSGGHIRIYSEPGQGTTVKLFLPPEPGIGTAAPEEPATPHRMPSGDETILVVEDDAQVRRLATGRLTALGYKVVECADGPSALAVLDTAQPVDLLFTDMVMPGGMNGRELAKQARLLRPDLKIVFTSGYAEAALADRGAADGSFPILTKPYSKSMLAEKIRGTLGERSRG